MSFKIPILTPLLFKNEYIQNNADEFLKDDNIAHFFIHSFKEQEIQLPLPLPPHKKTINDFVFITHGSMGRNLGIDSYKLKQYDFLFTPKNSITTTEFVSDDLEGFFCHFSDDFIGASPFLEQLHTQSLNENLIHIPEKQAENLKYLLTRILSLYKASNLDSKCYTLISYYLSTILAEVFLSVKDIMFTSRTTNNILSEFKNLVYQQFKQPIGVQGYASQLHITPNHLNKVVKTATGKTAMQMIHEVIILEAKVLLFQTQLTVNEISSILGFEDTSYFSRFFKKQTGDAPSKFRKKIDLS